MEFESLIPRDRNYFRSLRHTYTLFVIGMALLPIIGVFIIWYDYNKVDDVRKQQIKKQSVVLTIIFILISIGIAYYMTNFR